MGPGPDPRFWSAAAKACDWLEVRQEFAFLPAPRPPPPPLPSVDAAGARQPFAARKHSRVNTAGAAEDGAGGGERGETKRVATLPLCLCGAARFLSVCRSMRKGRNREHSVNPPPQESAGQDALAPLTRKRTHTVQQKPE